MDDAWAVLRGASFVAIPSRGSSAPLVADGCRRASDEAGTARSVHPALKNARIALRHPAAGSAHSCVLPRFWYYPRYPQ